MSLTNPAYPYQAGRMDALVISASRDRVRAGTTYHSFGDILSNGSGEEYPISDTDRSKIDIGSPLVIIDKPGCERANAEITKLEVTGKTGTGMKVYKVTFKNATKVGYKTEDDGIKINEWGTSVIDLP